MTTIDLYNLDLGPGATEHWAKARIGPFEVSLVPEYDKRRAALPANACKTVSRDFFEGDKVDDPLVDVVTTTFAPPRAGSWVVTATATYAEQDPSLESVLMRERSADHGLWDLCTLLTFATGRRVATVEALDRFDPTRYGTNACIAIETLHAAALAWNNREELVKCGLVYALQMHNEALGFAMLQVSAGLNNAALNVLVDRWSTRASLPSPEARRALKLLVSPAVDECSLLSDPEKSAFKAVLGSKIDQGLSGSLTERTRTLLVDLNIIDGAPSADVDRRIGFMNTIRNRLVHSGEPPLLKGLSMEQSMRYVTSIVAGVVPQITIAAVGQVLGFRRNALGSLSQNVDELTEFFALGRWRGWSLEAVSFEDWFYAEARELDDAVEAEAG